MPTRALQLEDIANQAMILGEMRGQLREVVHSVNNLSSKVDGLSREVIGLGPLAADIADIKTRVTKLEGADNRETGAKNLITWCLQSPLIGWIAAGVLLFTTWWKKP